MRMLPAVLLACMVAFPGNGAAYQVPSCEYRWPAWAVPVGWQLNRSCAVGAGEYFEPCRDALIAAFDTWSGVDCGWIAFEYLGSTEDGYDAWRKNDARNLLTWKSDSWPADLNGAVAVTASVQTGCGPGVFADSDILFNGKDQRWSAGGNPQAMDIRTVALHEIGHMVGLLDLYDVEGPVMYGAIQAGQQKRALTQDDIDGLCHLYPGELPPDSTGGSCDDEGCDGKQGYTCASDGVRRVCSHACSQDEDCPGRLLCQQLTPGSGTCFYDGEAGQGAECFADVSCARPLVCRAARDAVIRQYVCTTLCPDECLEGWECQPTLNDDSACLALRGQAFFEECSAMPCEAGLFCERQVDEAWCTSECGRPHDCPDGYDCVNLTEHKGCWPEERSKRAELTGFLGDPPSPVDLAVRVAFTATARAPHQALYQFWVTGPDGRRSRIREYSFENGFSWIGLEHGIYRFEAEVKDTASVLAADDTSELEYIVGAHLIEDGDTDTEGPAAGDGGGCAGSSGRSPAVALLLMALLTARRRRPC